jgi:hypothetical protein
VVNDAICKSQLWWIHPDASLTVEEYAIHQARYLERLIRVG